MTSELGDKDVGAATHTDNRRLGQGDRRQPSLKSFFYGAFLRRRRGSRREEDEGHAYPDWHATYLLVACVMILALSVIDGFLTVHLDNNGVREINSLLAFLVTDDAILFAVARISLTGVVAVVLVVTAHRQIYRIVKAAYALNFFFVVYLALVAYEIGLVRTVNYDLAQQAHPTAMADPVARDLSREVQ